MGARNRQYRLTSRSPPRSTWWPHERLGVRRSLQPATVAACWSWTLPGASWPSSSKSPVAFDFVTDSQNKKAADPVHRPAATSTAASGMPPEPHERDAGIVAGPFRSVAAPIGWRDTK